MTCVDFCHKVDLRQLLLDPLAQAVAHLAGIFSVPLCICARPLKFEKIVNRLAKMVYEYKRVHLLKQQHNTYACFHQTVN